MEELTFILLPACLVAGAAVMLSRRLGAGAYVLSVMLSVLAMGAVVIDPAFAPQEDGFVFTLAFMGPFVIFLYSIWGMLFGFPEPSEGRRRR